MDVYDEIIVGQGLAGTALAWVLRWKGRRILVIDRQNAVTSSRIAAGLMTPITGMRLVKSWRWDDFWGEAQRFYHRVEAETGSQVLQRTRMVRLLSGDRERDFYDQRRGTELQGLISEPELLVNENWFAMSDGGFEMLEAGRLDVATYLESSRQTFRKDGQYLQADIHPERDCILTDAMVELPTLGVKARRVIFCQGIDAIANPIFGNVPFKPAKGEILTLKIDDLEEMRTIHRGIWLTPCRNNQFHCGATYEWHRLDSIPTPEGRDEICSRLSQFLRMPIEVVGHDAAVRPILRHQQPALGLHPINPRFGFFNGLGSKGSLQSPWLARHFAGFLAGEHPLDPELDVQRILSDGP